MPTIVPGTPLHTAIDAIGKAAGEVFSQALSSPWKVEVNAEAAAQPADTACVYFGLFVSGNVQGSAALQVAGTDALLLAQKFLQEPLDSSAELNKDRKEALEELIRQVAGLAETALKSQFGDLKLQVSAIDAPDWTGATVALVASEAAAGTLALELRLSNELVASLSAPPATQASKTPSKEQEILATSENNLDLLLGVDLNLTLRFGQRVLTLREILDLTSGSVIELDRQVQEPADLLLGGKLIAKGEVVIVDGNYGIRITEVVDPRHRMSAV
jgi:flagellar motor switch protein FliN/FliY